MKLPCPWKQTTPSFKPFLPSKMAHTLSVEYVSLNKSTSYLLIKKRTQHILMGRYNKNITHNFVVFDQLIKKAYELILIITVKAK